MVRKETPEEKLARIADYWKDVEANLGLIKPEINYECLPEQIASVFGLSLSQAKAWLKKEPQYPANIADESLQKKRTDKDFTEPYAEPIEGSKQRNFG